MNPQQKLIGRPKCWLLSLISCNFVWTDSNANYFFFLEKSTNQMILMNSVTKCYVIKRNRVITTRFIFSCRSLVGHDEVNGRKGFSYKKEWRIKPVNLCLKSISIQWQRFIKRSVHKQKTKNKKKRNKEKVKGRLVKE